MSAPYHITRSMAAENVFCPIRKTIYLLDLHWNIGSVRHSQSWWCISKQNAKPKYVMNTYTEVALHPIHVKIQTIHKCILNTSPLFYISQEFLHQAKPLRNYKDIVYISYQWTTFAIKQIISLYGRRTKFW